VREKVTSFYNGGIFFCENQCTYDGTGKLCTSNDKHQPTPHQKKKWKWNHKSAHIKIAICHTGVWVSLNWVRNEQCEMLLQDSLV